LEEGFSDGVEAGTCLEACSVGAFPLPLAAVLSREETISSISNSSSNYSGTCSEIAFLLIGVFWGFSEGDWVDFLVDLAEGFVVRGLVTSFG